MADRQGDPSNSDAYQPLHEKAPLTATYARPPAQEPQYGVYAPPAGLAPAYPVYAPPGQGAPGPYVYNQQVIPSAMPVAYVPQGGYNTEYNAVVVQYSPGQLEVEDDDISCPIMGLILGIFIPLAGWITMCMNCSQRHSRRRRVIGMCAGAVSTAVFATAVIIMATRQ